MLGARSAAAAASPDPTDKSANRQPTRMGGSTARHSDRDDTEQQQGGSASRADWHICASASAGARGLTAAGAIYRALRTGRYRTG